MGNEHVTDKQFKNGVFTAFAVHEEIIKSFIKELSEPLEMQCFRGFFYVTAGHKAI